MNTPTPATPKAPSAQHTPTEAAWRTARALEDANGLRPLVALSLCADLIDRQTGLPALIAERDRLREINAELCEQLSNAVRCAERDAHGTEAPKWTVKARALLEAQKGRS